MPIKQHIYCKFVSYQRKKSINKNLDYLLLLTDAHQGNWRTLLYIKEQTLDLPTVARRSKGSSRNDDLFPGELIGRWVVMSYLLISNVELNLLCGRLVHSISFFGDLSWWEVNHLRSTETRDNPEVLWITQSSARLWWLQLCLIMEDTSAQSQKTQQLHERRRHLCSVKVFFRGSRKTAK